MLGTQIFLQPLWTPIPTRLSAASALGRGSIRTSSGLYSGAPIGIPYVVTDSRPAVTILFVSYAAESDPGPYPVPMNAPIEGQQADGSAFGVTAMCSSSTVMRISCMNWPTPTHRATGPGRLAAGQCFTWIQTMCALPGSPAGPVPTRLVFPSPRLVRYEEAASGVIRHALRFTVNTTRLLTCLRPRTGLLATRTLICPPWVCTYG